MNKTLVQTIMVFAVIVLLLTILYMLSSPFLLQPAHVSASRKSQEQFKNDLLTPNDVIVYQGVSVPTTQPSKVVYDTHESLPTVDGATTGPKSMFMMAFNKCDPSCCPSTYTCGGGCVCMTDKQKDFIGKRGNNSASRCALKDNVEY